MKQLSTTALSKSLNISSRELFIRLSELGLILREGKSWILTPQGKEKGGTYKESKQYGKYIVWPEDLSIKMPQVTPEKASVKLVTATVIARQLKLSVGTINAIFSKLAWINKDTKGWLITERGKAQGGIQT